MVLASGGYPADGYSAGHEIKGLDAAAKLDGKVFHAGSSLKDGKIINTGGRVLCATAMGDTVAEAQANAYKLAEQISWDGSFYRKDIGYRAIEREQQ